MHLPESTIKVKDSCMMTMMMMMMMVLVLVVVVVVEDLAAQAL